MLENMTYSTFSNFVRDHLNLSADDVKHEHLDAIEAEAWRIVVDEGKSIDPRAVEILELVEKYRGRSDNL